MNTIAIIAILIVSIFANNAVQNVKVANTGAMTVQTIVVNLANIVVQLAK